MMEWVCTLLHLIAAESRDELEMCGNDGVGVHLIAAESRDELEEVAREVMPRIDHAGKQVTERHFFKRAIPS